MKYLKLVYKTHALIWLLTTEWKTSCFRSECWWPTCPPPCWSSSSADGSATASAARTTPTGATSAPPPPLHPQCCRRRCRERRSGWWTWYWERQIGMFCKIHFLQDRMFCLDIAPKPTSIYRIPKGNPAKESSGLRSPPILSAFHQNTFQGIFPNLLRIFLGEKFALKRFEQAFIKLELSPRKVPHLEARSIPLFTKWLQKFYRSSLLFSQMKK